MPTPNEAHEQQTTTQDSSNEFLDLSERSSQGFLREVLRYLRSERTWLLAPIILMLLLFGVFVIFGSGIAAPFIYTLF